MSEYTKLITELRGHIREVHLTLLRDAADALEAAEQRIAELEAQMSKEGEWRGLIIDGQYWAITCSNCHQVGFNARTPYCPNCGAKMKTVTDCHTSGEGER